MEEHFVFPPDARTHDQRRRQKTALLQTEIRKAVKRSVVAGSSFDRRPPFRFIGKLLDLTRTKTLVFYEILATCQILKTIFPRFKSPSAPQQLCTPLRSSNARGGTKMESSRPPLCDWLHLPPHPRFSKTKSQLLLNCWSPPHTRVYVAMSFSSCVYMLEIIL